MKQREIIHQPECPTTIEHLERWGMRMMHLTVMSLLSWIVVAPGIAQTLKPFHDKPALGGSGVVVLAAQSEVRGMEFDVYIRLQNGMSEGELLVRAGKPDSESIESIRNDIVRTFYYFPTVSNPWITAVTVRGGRIANIERTKKAF